MMRPMKLQIAPHETYPCTRENSTPPIHSMEIEDMPQMAAFVYEFYIKKVEALKAEFEGSKKTWEKPGTVKETVPEHFVSSHPGGEDSDSEEEQEQEATVKEDVKPEENKETTESKMETNNENIEGLDEEELEERQNANLFYPLKRPTPMED